MHYKQNIKQRVQHLTHESPHIKPKETQIASKHTPLLLEACTIMGKQHYFFDY